MTEADCRDDIACARALVSACARLHPGATLCPLECAQGLARDGGHKDWHGLVAPLRAGALRLAREGRLALYRDGRAADPFSVRGAFRFALPSAA